MSRKLSSPSLDRIRERQFVNPRVVAKIISHEVSQFRLSTKHVTNARRHSKTKYSINIISK